MHTKKIMSLSGFPSFPESPGVTLNFALLAPLVSFKLPEHATKDHTLVSVAKLKGLKNGLKFAHAYLAYIGVPTYTDENRASLHKVLLAITTERTRLPKDKADEIDAQLVQHLGDVRCFPDHYTQLIRLLAEIKIMTNVENIEGVSPEITVARRELLRAIYQHIEAAMTGVGLQIDALFGQDSDPQSTHLVNGVRYALERRFGWGNSTPLDVHATNTPLMTIACTTFAIPHITLESFANGLSKYVAENQSETWSLLTYLIGPADAQEILNKVREGYFNTPYTNDSGQFQLSVPDAQKLIEKFMRDLQGDASVPATVSMKRFKPLGCPLRGIVEQLLRVNTSPITMKQFNRLKFTCDPQEPFGQIRFSIEELMVAHMNSDDAGKFWKKTFPDASDPIEIEFLKLRSSVNPQEDNPLIYAKKRDTPHQVSLVVAALAGAPCHSKHVIDYLATISRDQLKTELIQNPGLIKKLIVHNSKFLTELGFSQEELKTLLKVVIKPDSGDTLAHELARGHILCLSKITKSFSEQERSSILALKNNQNVPVLQTYYQYNPTFIEAGVKANPKQADKIFGDQTLTFIVCVYHPEVLMRMLPQDDDEQCLRIFKYRGEDISEAQILANKASAAMLALLQSRFPEQTREILQEKDAQGMCGYRHLAKGDPNGFVDYLLTLDPAEAKHILAITTLTGECVIHALAGAPEADLAFSKLKALFSDKEREHFYTQESEGSPCVYVRLASSNPKVIIAELNKNPARGVRLLQLGEEHRKGVLGRLCATPQVTELGEFLKRLSQEELGVLFTGKSSKDLSILSLARHDIDSFMELLSRFDTKRQMEVLSASYAESGTPLETLATHHPKALIVLLNRFKDTDETLLAKASLKYTNVACHLAHIHPCELIDFIEENPTLRKDILRTTTRDGAPIAHILARTVQGGNRYMVLLNRLPLEEALEMLQMTSRPTDIPTLNLAAGCTNDHLAEIILSCPVDKQCELLNTSRAGFAVAFTLARSNPKMMVRILANMEPQQIVKFLTVTSPRGDSIAQELAECASEALNGLFLLLDTTILLSIMALSNDSRETVAQKLAEINPSVCLTQFQRIIAGRVTVDVSEQIGQCLGGSPTTITLNAAQRLAKNPDTVTELFGILERLKATTVQSLLDHFQVYTTVTGISRIWGGEKIALLLAEADLARLLRLMIKNHCPLVNMKGEESATMLEDAAQREPELVLALLEKYKPMELRRNLKPDSEIPESARYTFLNLLLAKNPQRMLNLLMSLYPKGLHPYDIGHIFKACGEDSMRSIIEQCSETLIALFKKASSDHALRILRESPVLMMLIRQIKPEILSSLKSHFKSKADSEFQKFLTKHSG